MKRNLFSLFVIVGMLALGGMTFAQTAGQSATATVVASNTLSITAGGTLSLAPTSAAAASNNSTTLDFSTNDGATHSITVVADTGGWAFVPTTTGVTTTVYPTLSFTSATATAGSASSTAGSLISSTNALGAAVNVVTAITNVSGTATVTLGSTVTVAVPAGSYAASLTYTLQ